LRVGVISAARRRYGKRSTGIRQSAKHRTGTGRQDKSIVFHGFTYLAVTTEICEGVATPVTVVSVVVLAAAAAVGAALPPQLDTKVATKKSATARIKAVIKVSLKFKTSRGRQ
jgi:hypothetical protein